MGSVYVVSMAPLAAMDTDVPRGCTTCALMPESMSKIAVCLL